MQQNVRQRQHVTPKASNSGTSRTSNSIVGQAFDQDDSISSFDVPVPHTPSGSLTPIDLVQGRLDHDDPYPPDGYRDNPDNEYEQDYDDLEYDEDMHVGPFPSEPNEEDFDPFVVECENRQDTPNSHEIPGYLLVIYATVSWLHMHFYLPRVACNALLAIIARLLTFLDPHITLPFITLISATRSLGIDTHIELLAVCPNCRDVYPSAGSKHVQDACTLCDVPLFLPDLTKRGNRRTIKTPIIKYPYLSLSDQLKSLLVVPGVEVLLDGWREKPCSSGHYTNIFDGKVCRFDLKAPDGSPFFSNLPHQKNGPNGELRIGVNLGVDWYVCHYSNPTY